MFLQSMVKATLCNHYYAAEADIDEVTMFAEIFFISSNLLTYMLIYYSLLK